MVTSPSRAGRSGDGPVARSTRHSSAQFAQDQQDGVAPWLPGRPLHDLRGRLARRSHAHRVGRCCCSRGLGAPVRGSDIARHCPAKVLTGGRREERVRVLVSSRWAGCELGRSSGQRVAAAPPGLHRPGTSLRCQSAGAGGCASSCPAIFATCSIEGRRPASNCPCRHARPGARPIPGRPQLPLRCSAGMPSSSALWVTNGRSRSAV